MAIGAKKITLPITNESTGTVSNVEYSFVQVDNTLTQSGAAADAKKTGDELSDLKQDLEGLDVYTLGLYPQMSVADTAVASFTDGADDIPVKSLTVDVTARQGNSGDPSPSNVRPIYGWTGANVVRSRTRYFAKDFTGDGYKSGYRLLSDGSEVSTGGYVISGYIPVSANASCLVFVPSGVSTPSICFYTENKTYISGEAYNNRPKFTITAPENCAYCRMTSFHSEAYPWMFEECGIAETYTTYPITFPSSAGTVYGGTLDVTSGVLTVTNGYADLGTLNWSLNATNVYFLSRYNVSPNEFIKTPTQNSNYANLMCSKYARNTAYNVMNGNSGIGCTTDGYLVVVDTNYADATAFKESLSGVQLVYELLEPQTYQLTPTEVATILGQNNIFCDTGNINELTYRADLKAYIDAHVGS